MIKKSAIIDLKIRKRTIVPKYIQIAESITNDIANGKINHEERIPSINELSEKNGVSRDTIEKAYKILRQRNLIFSVKGVGNFVSINIAESRLKIIFLINKSSFYKMEMYNAFAASIGKAAYVDLYIYNSDDRLFSDFLKKNLNTYNYFVIMPDFTNKQEKHVNYTTNIIKEIKKISKDKVIILDNCYSEISDGLTIINHDWRKDIFIALHTGLKKIMGYKKIIFIYPEKSFFSYPKDVLKGFIDFCEIYHLEFEIIYKIPNELKFEKKELYITVKDSDLVLLLEQITEKNKAVGTDVGIISYDDTPLKALLGITVMSANFKALGEKAAEHILNNKTIVLQNAFQYIERDSL
jgi:DNA-binding transcriptional regulator YhcF (GntR family)